jgi:hypothetical protein
LPPSNGAPATAPPASAGRTGAAVPSYSFETDPQRQAMLDRFRRLGLV